MDDHRQLQVQLTQLRRRMWSTWFVLLMFMGFFIFKVFFPQRVATEDIYASQILLQQDGRIVGALSATEDGGLRYSGFSLFGPDLTLSIAPPDVQGRSRVEINGREIGFEPDGPVPAGTETFD